MEAPQNGADSASYTAGATAEPIPKFNYEAERRKPSARMQASELHNYLDLSQKNAVETWAALLEIQQYPMFTLVDEKDTVICSTCHYTRWFFAMIDETRVYARANLGEPTDDHELKWCAIDEGARSQLKKLLQSEFETLSRQASRGVINVPKLSGETLQDAVNIICEEHPINPRLLYIERAMRKHPEHVETLGWDGVPRLDTVLQHAGFGLPEDMDIEGVEDGYEDTYCTALAHTIFMGAVERTTADPEQGVLIDVVPIFIGDGGTGKTSFLKTISDGSNLYGEAGPINSGKNVRSPAHAFFDPVRSKLIGELVECTQMHRSTVGQLKNYIDETRPEYANLYEASKRHPLTCVFVGTTNNRDVLKDATGNRRFAPIESNLIHDAKRDIMPMRERPAEYVEQLWAEAYYRVKVNGESWRDCWKDPACVMVQTAYTHDVLEVPDLMDAALSLLEEMMKEAENLFEYRQDGRPARVPQSEFHLRFIDMYGNTARVSAGMLRDTYNVLCKDAQISGHENRYGYALKNLRDENGKQHKCFVRHH